MKFFSRRGAKTKKAGARLPPTAQPPPRKTRPATKPPLIIRYSASSVPILQLSIHSDTIPEQQLFDVTINQLRTQLITIPGVLIPYPYGGRQRQVVGDLDPGKLPAGGNSPQEVSNAGN